MVNGQGRTMKSLKSNISGTVRDREKVSIILFLCHMPNDATEGVVEHSFLGCNHQSTYMPQLQPCCSAAALVPNVLPRRIDEGSGKPCAVDRTS